MLSRRVIGCSKSGRTHGGLNRNLLDSALRFLVPISLCMQLQALVRGWAARAAFARVIAALTALQRRRRALRIARAQRAEYRRVCAAAVTIKVTVCPLGHLPAASR